MTGTAPLSDDRQIAGVIAAALRLAGATQSVTPDGVHEAALPTATRHYFGNRSNLRYTLDRRVRQYHADVEYATVGSALVTQAIQFIRENTSIVHTRNVVNGAKPEDLVRALIDRSLTLRSVQPEPLPPDYLVRAQVVVTMVSDDRRSFLHEVLTPLDVPLDRVGPAAKLAAVAANTGDAHRDLPGSVREIVTRVIETAEVQLKPTIAARESELEAQLQEASRRLARPALEALRRDLALKVELDVALLELVRLGRIRYRSTVFEPTANAQHEFFLEAYDGQSIQVACPVCKGHTARLDLCSDNGAHLACPACSMRCSVCSARRCRQHPVGPCVDATCHDGFCSNCTRSCSQCGGRACAQHLAECAAGCGGASCTNCRGECVFEPGLVQHSSHLLPCRDCGRAVCMKHGGTCGVEAAGAPLICVDDLAVCAVDNHSLSVCKAHSGACAACGHVACSQHQKPCADCGRPACTRDAQPCAIGGEWLLRIHGRRCEDCGDTVCAGHSSACSACARVFCSRHLVACAVGGEVVCRFDSTACHECGESCCEKHVTRCVVTGGHPVCARDRCRSSCSEDGRPVCHTHEVICERGQEATCPTHALRCNVGGEKLCGSHALSCEIGAERYCEAHVAECAVCGRSTCNGCAAFRLPDGSAVCDACRRATREPDAPGLLKRSVVDRVLVRQPLVSRSRSLVTVASISRLRAEVRTFDTSGALVGSRRLGSDLARAYEQLLAEGARMDPPAQTTR